jgi:alpha-L-rhamnosidase
MRRHAQLLPAIVPARASAGRKMKPILFVLALLTPAFAAGLTPYGLETEARVTPVGIDVPRPRLSWKLESPDREQKQTAYRVLAATSAEKLAQGEADLWDSGRVASEETAWIAFAGAPLHSFQGVWWRVRVWDVAGTASAWSAPAEFTMAVTDPKDWHASWIAYPESKLSSGPLPIFRKEVSLSATPTRALVFISGLGFHELRINGAKVGDHVLAPAWTNYRDSVLYETYDVTALLKTGPNALGVLLGNGFYNVAGGRYAKFTGSFGQPRLFLQLHLEFAGGATREVGTDGSWRTHYGPLTFSCIYGGEDFDARLEPPGWDSPGFDSAGWRAAATTEAPGGVLTAQASPPVRVQQSFSAVRVTEPKPGIAIYDLGQNFAGWPRIEVSGAAGGQVKLTPGELLDADGLVTQRSSGGPEYFTYTLKGAGTEVWSPRFSYYGFRYVQVETTGAPTIRGLTGQFVHLDAPRIGSFSCSSELLNRIHALIDAAIRSNLQHVLTDCPHREKLGWLEQSHLMGPSLLYNWDLRAFLPKIVRDTREAQTVDGLVPDIAPEYVTFASGFRDSPEWGSAAVLLPWLAWTWYGDRQPLADSYSTMARYMDYLESRSANHLLSYGLGDWYDIGPGRPGYSQLTPRGLTASALWFADLRTLEKTARLLGRAGDAGKFASQAASVQAAFLQARFAATSQTALAMPYVLGLASDPAAIPNLVADIRQRDNHTDAGDIGYHYVIRALLDAGRGDVLFDMATRTDAPSYGAQLAAGATALTEAWDASPGSSQNHLMLGHLEEWFYAGLAGIRPDTASPGLRRIRIEPEVVGGLTSVDATWDTFRGPVAVHWRLAGDDFHMTVEIPPGIDAEVSLPGKPARPMREIASGRYEFEVKGLRP